MLDEIIGGSRAIERIRKVLPALSRLSTPLIIVGEPGVGKMFLAAHIHAMSSRNARPVQSLNFSTLSEREQRIAILGGEPPELTTNRRSILELPTTVVLKHIDAASHYLHDRLAESIRSGRVSRSGSNKLHPVACRLIFTFRKPIAVLSRENRLSPLLLALLRRGRRLHLPPLRERREDISLLAEYCLRNFHERQHADPREAGLTVRGIDSSGHLDPALESFLIRQFWPDNVRDLVTYLTHLLAYPYDEALLEREKLELTKILTMLEDGSEFSLGKLLSAIEADIIERAVSKMRGHQAKAAQLLGLSVRAVRRKKRTELGPK